MSTIESARKVPGTPFAPGTFTPAPGSGHRGRMLFMHAKVEVSMMLRHGEQLLLTVLIPIALLIGLSVLNIVPTGSLDGVSKVDWTTPRILALAVMSSAFTGQAIALGFDRRYGVLKRLVSTALPVWLLVAGRLTAAVVIVAIQMAILGVVAAALGWTPVGGGIWAAALILVVGTLSFAALGLLLGGSLRAEIVLALANVIWFALLLAGGLLLAPNALPAGLATVVELLPSGALAEGLRAALVDGLMDWPAFAVLGAWAAAAGLLATRTTRLS